MEVPGGYENKTRVLLYEVLGTALLIFSLNASESFDVYQPEAVAVTLYSICTFIGPISGGHVNPAVTLGVFIREGRERIGENVIYMLMLWVAQLIGAVIGVLLFTLTITKTGENQYFPGVANLCPPIARTTDCTVSTHAGNYGFHVIAVEAIACFIFISSVLNVKYHSAPGEGRMGNLTVALCLFCGILISAPVSGGGMNPALSIV